MMKMMKTTIYIAGLVFLASVIELGAAEAWFRRLDIDAYENIIGLSRVSASEAAEINAYLFIYDSAGRLNRVEYRCTGHALPDPSFGVQRIEIFYEGRSIYRKYTDGTGKPMADESGIWGTRVILDRHGRNIGVVFYDEYENIVPDMKGIAQRLWTLDKSGRKSLERFFDSFGARVVDNRGVAAIQYQWNSSDKLIERRYLSLEGSPVLARDEGVYKYRWIRDERGYPVREDRFGIQGEPIIAADGSAVIEWVRDENGRVTKEFRR
ncbi:MAG: hypothetical protein B6D68_01295, partial [spirochete symbiont of Stewartia floridana]